MPEVRVPTVTRPDPRRETCRPGDAWLLARGLVVVGLAAAADAAGRLFGGR